MMVATKSASPSRAMNSNRSAKSLNSSGAADSKAISRAASAAFAAPHELDLRKPNQSNREGREKDLSDPGCLSKFKNYQFRHGAYPGYLDCSKHPLWLDSALSEHTRRQESPVRVKYGKYGRTNFKPNERVCGDLQYARNPTAKKAHEFIWYNLKDPDVFGLKPPRRWDPAGVKKLPPKPFYNREDGHLLLNNTCTIVNLCLIPEIRRLQCHFLPKLPKIRSERNFATPIKKIRRQDTGWRWTQTWKRQLIPWYTSQGPDVPEVAKLKAQERLDLDWQHSRHHYKKNRETIEKLRAFHRSVKEIVKPTIKPIDYHVPVGRDNLKGVRMVEDLFEDRILSFWVDPPVDILEILKAEEEARKLLEEEQKRKDPTPPPPPSLCDACPYYGEDFCYESPP